MSSRQTRSKSDKSATSATAPQPLLSQPAGISKPKSSSKSPRKPRQITAPTPYYKKYTLHVLIDKTLPPATSLRPPFPCYSTHLDARRAGHPLPVPTHDPNSNETLRAQISALETENAQLKAWWSANRGRDCVMEQLQARAEELEDRNRALVGGMERLAGRLVAVKEEREGAEKRVGEVRRGWEAEVQLLGEMVRDGEGKRREGGLGEVGWKGWWSLGFGFGFGVV